MIRKVSVLALAAATAAAAGGCRSNCGSGWFTSRGSNAPCQLAGSSGACMDGTPVGGSFPAGVPGGVIPGGGYPPPGGGYGAPVGPSELPPPQPTDLIPRPGVPTQPFAVPSPAPGEGGANLLPAPKGGVPVGR
ncbi:MAG TPA: hypothetical protein VD866_17495 [Urbifossiella sp.]|nr:hypothetical protein [Urbifossiella sp.]